MTWTDEARCTGRTNVMFSNFVLVAKRLCGACPVAEACLQDAMATECGLPLEERYGIRGGVTPAERHALEHGQEPQKKANVPLRPHNLKPCVGCSEMKPLHEFRGKTGRRCIDCRHAYDRNKREARRLRLGDEEFRRRSREAVARSRAKAS